MQRLLTELDELREENRRLRNEKGDVEEQLNAVLKENKKLKNEIKFLKKYCERNRCSIYYKKQILFVNLLLKMLKYDRIC